MELILSDDARTFRDWLSDRLRDLRELEGSRLSTRA
jgi:hypothetical protein